MDQSKLTSKLRTLHQTAMPERVSLICDGLLRINADFLSTHLHKLLDEFEKDLFNNASSLQSQTQQIGQYSQLRNLKRTRYDFIPHFLSNFEHQLASIRPETLATKTNEQENNDLQAIGMQLLDVHMTDEQQIQFEISSRCESQNSFDIFLLGQRFGVLAGQPAFDADKLPLGPKVFCQCLQESIKSLDLTELDKKTVYYLFERYIFSNFSILLGLCNQFLIENGVLPNLSYIPFRNPELRRKKSPISSNANKSHAHSGKTSEPNDDTSYSNVYQFNSGQSDNATDEERFDPNLIEESFTNLRQLLSKRKQLLNKLSSYTNQYQNENSNDTAKSSEVSAEALSAILSQFQNNAANNPNTRVSIQNLKHDLLVHLRNQSTDTYEVSLKAEDSDAIDLVGLLMDIVLKDVSPSSSVSQLLSLMQTPLIRVALKDKTFFSDRIHPARQMLNILAETGFNWIDNHQNDDALHSKITNIVSKTVRDFKGDNQELVGAYQETDQILQTLIKKANTTERRQVEAARGKERLIAARIRAENTMLELVENYEIPDATLNLLKNSWADVMALTELRQGSNSTDWLEQKQIAESIIAANLPKAEMLDSDLLEGIKTKIQESLALIGYDQNEALLIAKGLLEQRPDAIPEASLMLAEKIRFGSNTQSANQQAFQLNSEQLVFVEQIKKMPIGTWFEFFIKESGISERRKLAWISELSNQTLFVNQRGQKVAEMMIEDLAIELYDGTAKIQSENKRSIFIMAFKNLLGSLKELMPEKKDVENE